MTVEIKRLGPQDRVHFDGMLDVFADAFDDAGSYSSKRPSPNYAAKLLRSDHFVGLVAVLDEQVAGALAAYELIKFEQERSEFYIYDIAVREQNRRRGIATQLILALKPIAAARNAKIMFVQAVHGDDPAIALYAKLGARQDVAHFDIETD
jgi:aminoglycoside 3-N-acetyltransferase I